LDLFTRIETRPWHESPIHCIDFEGSQSSGVVEYGLVTIEGGEVVDMKTRLCRPIGRISALETATHLIDEKQVGDAKLFEVEWDLFMGRRSGGPFAAHHAQVENMLIKTAWSLPARCPDFLSQDWTVEWGPWLDSCALYRNLFEGLDSYRLGDLIARFKLQDQLDGEAVHWCPSERSHYHAAGYDALASAMLILQLMEYEELRDLTLPQLMAWAQSGGGPCEGDQMELL